MPLKLEIITPEKIVYSEEVVDAVVLPTPDGEIGILAGHQPILTVIEAGEIQAEVQRDKLFLAVDHGFARVLGDTVSILTEAAIDVKDIDLSAVQEAQERAQEALRVARTKKDFDPAEIERLESITRFAIAQRLLKRKKR